MKTFYFKINDCQAGLSHHCLNLSKTPLAPGQKGEGRFIAIKLNDEKQLRDEILYGLCFPVNLLPLMSVVENPIGEDESSDSIGNFEMINETQVSGTGYQPVP